MEENNNLYKEPQKSKFGQGLITGILVCLVIGLSAFIIYDKVLSKDKDNNTNSDNQQEVTPSASPESNNNDSNNNTQSESKELDINSTIVNSLSKLFILDKVNSSFFDKDDLSTAWSFVYGDGLYSKDVINSSDLSVDTKLLFAYKSLGILYNVGESYLESEIKEEYIKLFGNNNYKVVDEIYNLKYNATTKKYESVGIIGGNETLYVTNTKIQKAILTKDSSSEKIQVYVKVAFSGDISNSTSVEYYSDYYRKNLIETANQVNWNNNSYPTFIFVFESDGNGNYIFTSVEKAK